MARRFVRTLPLLGLSVFLGCPSGYRLSRIEGEPPSVTATSFSLAICTRAESHSVSQCAERLVPFFHCTDLRYRDLCRTTPAGSGRREALRSGEVPKAVLAFSHFSDAQLKEHRVHLDGPTTEGIYDGLITGADRAEALERNDDAVLLATMLATNAIGRHAPPSWDTKTMGPAPSAPRFAIHTGDAVDSGMFSELTQFLAATETLEMPFYNLIGNHDGLVYGALPADRVTGLNVVNPFVPILDADRFMRAHSVASTLADPTIPPLVRDRLQVRPGLTVSAVAHPATASGCRVDAEDGCVAGDAALNLEGSFAHGFDFVCQTRDTPLCPEARGYYTFDALAEDKSLTIQVIVLNTSEVPPTTVLEGLVERRARAQMLPEQLRWLRRELARPNRFFLVFGHHDLASFHEQTQGDDLRNMLATNDHVLAYFAGHTHRDAMTAFNRPGGGTLWQIVAGSTLVYPQLAHLVEVMRGNDERLFLRILSYRQTLGDEPGSEVPPPDNVQSLCAPLTPKGTSSLCSRLARRAHMGREGARADTNDSDNTTEPNAIPKANALLLVYDPPASKGPPK